MAKKQVKEKWDYQSPCLIPAKWRTEREYAMISEFNARILYIWVRATKVARPTIV